MKLAALPRAETAARLRGGGLPIESGPFVFNLRGRSPDIVDFAHTLYPENRVADADIVHSEVAVRRHFNPRRPWRREVRLFIDRQPLLQPLPYRFAAPMLEWGINFTVGSRAHHLLIVHAAVAERRGRAVVMAAVSGSGKSTLCTALVSAGWRLFSDEFALIRPVDGAVLPAPRPISLKNESIDVVQRLMPHAVMSRRYVETVKGTLAYLRPDDEAIRRQFEPAVPAWIVFPKFRAGAPVTVSPVSRARAFRDLVANSMNYEPLAERGFTAVARMVETCDAFNFEYSDMAEAIAHFDRLSSA